MSPARRPRGLSGASRRGRPAACGCPAAGPAPPGPAREQASSAGRSTPVSMPISWSIETRSSVAMLPVAPAGTGQPPSSPKLDSKDSTPDSSAASTFASPWPAGVVEVRCQLDTGELRAGRARRTRAPAAGWPSRSCRRSRSPARPRRAAQRRSRAPARAGTSPSYGQPKDVEITPSQRSPAAGARAEHLLQARKRLGDRAVHVLAVVGLGGRQEHVDLVEGRPRSGVRLAQLQRARRVPSRWGSAPTG